MNAMKHLTEEQLIEHRYGDAENAAAVEEHLYACAECREAFAALERVLAAVDELPVAEPEAGYETRLWHAIQLRLGRPKVGFAWSVWREWIAPRRLVSIGAVAAMIAAAFLAGRYTGRLQPNGPASDVTNINAPIPPQVRERILLVAVGDHLDRAQTVLLEISNADADGTGREAAHQEVNISDEQTRAENLLEANRIYRQTAEHSGDNAVANVLDELEPVLLDIVHSPPNVSAVELSDLQKRIAAEGLLLKVRVLDSTVRNESKVPVPSGTRGL
jgi:hypothetical protein